MSLLTSSHSIFDFDFPHRWIRLTIARREGKRGVDHVPEAVLANVKVHSAVTGALAQGGKPRNGRGREAVGARGPSRPSLAAATRLQPPSKITLVFHNKLRLIA